MAGVGVSLGTLGLVRDDGRPCLSRCSHTTISRLRLSDRPLEFSAPARSCTVRAAVRRRAPGFFSGARLRTQASAILEALFAQTAGLNLTVNTDIVFSIQKTPTFIQKGPLFDRYVFAFWPDTPPIPRRRVREPQATVISQAGQRCLFAPGRGDQIILRPVRFAPLGLTVCSPRTENA